MQALYTPRQIIETYMYQEVELDMASSHPSNSAAKSIRFFKIVLTDIGSHNKLMIPRKFVRLFGKNLDDRIHLSAPSGPVWSIDLEKDQNKVWLQNGWPEFAKFYSISFGYLLVFEYKEDSKFEVLILDPSASEIDYPAAPSDNLTFAKSTQAEKRGIDINISSDSDEIRPGKRTRGSSSSIEPCHNGQNLLHESANVNGGSACDVKKINVLAAAKAFKSENPYFIVSMTPSYLNASSGLHITKTFEKVYNKWMNNVEVNLEVGGKTWPVYSRVHSNPERQRCVFRHGWKDFAEDNSLNVGDVCVFELIDPSKKLLKVHISKNMRG